MKMGHNKSIDWYLFGVLLFELLTGSPPYFSNNREQLFQNIVKGKLFGGAVDLEKAIADGSFKALVEG